MAAQLVTPLPPPPLRSNPVDFSDRTEALLLALGRFVDEINAATPGDSAAGLAQYLASEDEDKGAALVAFKQNYIGAARRLLSLKLQEWVSVTDFPNVDRTGVSDSTAGINAAIAAMPSGGVLVLPAGTYQVRMSNIEQDWINDPQWTNNLRFGIQIKDKASFTIQAHGATLRLANSQIAQNSDVYAALHIYRCPGLRVEGLTIDGNAANNGQNFSDGSAMVLTSGQHDNISINGLRIVNSSVMGAYFGYNLGGHCTNLRVRSTYINGATYGLIFDNTIKGVISDTNMEEVGVGMQFIGVGVLDHDLVINNFNYKTSYSEGALLFDKVRGLRINNVTINAVVADFYGAITTFQAVSQPTSDQEDIVISNVNARVSGAHARVIYTDRNSKLEVSNARLTLTGSDQQVCFVVGSSELTLRSARIVSGASAHVQVAGSSSFYGYNIHHRGTPVYAYNVSTTGRLLLNNAFSDNSLPSTITAADFIHTGTKNLRMSVSSTYTASGTGASSWSIPHGLGGAPRELIVTPQSSDASTGWFATADATNITFAFKTAPPTGTNNIKFAYKAEL